jgi:urease accessory protein
MKRILTLALLLGTATLASAHTGHGTHGVAEGLAHPLGLDHLLAMVAVGLWSALALPTGRRWQGPATFMAAMTVGAVLGAAGLGLPFVEQGIALSVALFGAMLIAAKRMPAHAGLAAVAAAAALHGLAHGAELPVGAAFVGYAAGFLATTGALHAAGLGLAARLKGVSVRVWHAAGGALGLAGLALLIRA